MTKEEFSMKGNSKRIKLPVVVVLIMIRSSLIFDNPIDNALEEKPLHSRRNIRQLPSEK